MGKSEYAPRTINGVDVLAAGLGFTEGPVIRHADSGLTVVAVDLGAVHELNEAGATRTTLVGGGINAAAEWEDGSLFLAQNGGRGPGHLRATLPGGIQILRKGEEPYWLSTHPLSPNDLCFGPDNYLYVTDPTRIPARSDGRIWRIDPRNGDGELVARTDWYPNGIAFGPSGRTLYVASTGEQRIVRFDVADDGGLSDPATFANVAGGYPDGIAFDVEGNLYVATLGIGDVKGSVHIYSSSGALVDILQASTSRFCTNVALDAEGTLFVTDAGLGGVLVLRRAFAPQLPLYPFRAQALD